MGRTYAFTGKLAAMTQAEAARRVRESGGEVQPDVSRRIDVLVVGERGWSMEARGGISRKLRHARRLRRKGARIRILSEREFLEQELGMETKHGYVDRYYAADRISRILGLPVERIEAWERAGLVRAARHIHREPLFSFQSIVELKQLATWMAQGMSAAEIQRSLGGLRRLFPSVERPLAQLRIAAEHGHLLVLDRAGPVDPDGQIHLDLGQPPERPSGESVPLDSARDLDALFDRACAAADDPEQRDQARQAFRRILDQRPDDPDAWCELGLLHLESRELAEAEAALRRGLAADAEHVECLSNLGVVQDARGQVEAAIASFERAVELAPDFAKAVFNLAAAYEKTGQRERARPVWKSFLALEPEGEHAEIARGYLDRE